MTSLIVSQSAQPLIIDLRCYDEHQDSHSHDYHQLVLPLEGKLNLQIDGREGVVDAQQAAIICAGDSHAFAAFEANRFVVADVPVAWANILDTLPPFLPLTPSLSCYIQFIATRLQEGELSEHGQRQILLLLLELMAEPLSRDLSIDKRVNAARAFLDGRLASAVSLEEVAAVAHLSVRQLSELFKQQLGISPHQYLVNKRMQTAAGLLSNSLLSVQQIAEQVGYQSAASFSSRFASHFGHSPSQFRQNDKLKCRFE